ncbi:hypothetical protein ASPWEDRAFT_34502 [Aspergillus wentii DTO 134E9]|uniref:Cupin type-2 domain-containing protein n=1 Tax=Aspergillus wentii DTO 134E9 TaxID=1073089 RepID=A0A1L9S1J3_ASPWE|nr:uncharacterized protein ASPWEDRAFT_34502 [Aspergillus wentii DTO 134E9]KAI9930979.1 hypothetical protein MW887_010634 [Aspergillus wentii]OJJ41028.1 hypothetical protein ASPWEDRAFT_34502 [Aspergillus wentii DTO 134E9]
MLSFLRTKISRTKTVTNNPVYFDGGRSSIEFKSPSDRYLVINRWPPASTEANRNIALRPPLHWHRHQTEQFHVLHGTAKFICGGEDVLKKAGESMTIPMKAFHTFCNASESEEMVVELVLEPKWRNRDEAFFRNAQSYRDDCRKAGVPRSLPQVLLFNWAGGVVLALPGPVFIARPLGVLMNFFGGLVLGKWILGYKDSYPEYCQSR